MPEHHRSTLYVWESGGLGEWYTIAALIPGEDAVMPFVTRSLHHARFVEPLARAHGRARNEEVRLARYRYEGVEV